MKARLFSLFLMVAMAAALRQRICLDEPPRHDSSAHGAWGQRLRHLVYRGQLADGSRARRLDKFASQTRRQGVARHASAKGWGRRWPARRRTADAGKRSGAEGPVVADPARQRGLRAIGVELSYRGRVSRKQVFSNASSLSPKRQFATHFSIARSATDHYLTLQRTRANWRVCPCAKRIRTLTNA
jgi:hypothetical protein